MNPNQTGMDMNSAWLMPQNYISKGILQEGLTVKTDGTTTVLRKKANPWFKSKSFSYGSTS